MVTDFFPKALVSLDNSTLIIYPVNFDYKPFYEYMPFSMVLGENVRIENGCKFEMDYYYYKYVSLHGQTRSDFESEYSFCKRMNSNIVKFLDEFSDDQKELAKNTLFKSKVVYKLPWILGFLKLFKDQKWFKKKVKSEEFYYEIHKEFFKTSIFYTYSLWTKHQKKSYNCKLYNYSIRIDYGKMENLRL